jgi:hypothetical protein
MHTVQQESALLNKWNPGSAWLLLPCPGASMQPEQHITTARENRPMKRFEARQPMRQWGRWAAGIVVALGLSAHAAAANIVVNDSFETGDFTGWTLAGNSTFFDDVECPGVGLVPRGECDAFFGAFDSDDTLSQTLATIAGAPYSITFFFASDGGVVSHFSASFGGATLIDLVNPAASPYTLYSFTRTATGASTPLSFSFRDDTGFLRLDAVSVAVPEPATLGLIGIAVAAMGFGRRRAARVAVR